MIPYTPSVLVLSFFYSLFLYFDLSLNWLDFLLKCLKGKLGQISYSWITFLQHLTNIASLFSGIKYQSSVSPFIPWLHQYIVLQEGLQGAVFLEFFHVWDFLYLNDTLVGCNIPASCFLSLITLLQCILAVNVVVDKSEASDILQKLLIWMTEELLIFTWKVNNNQDKS